ncbi:prohibitin family protein [Phaeobacter italicus]|jgi:regulator of protease activity HflC (stomatin/prohibitin superfamily)|uniref:prohibitin family protein n=1 Tax=Phaeobacter italicus TaxID=481446 RepID=UPI002FDEC214
MAVEIRNTGRYTYEKTRKDRYGDVKVTSDIRLGAIIRDIAIGIGSIVVLGFSFFTVGEGERGVVTRFGEAQYQVGPGLHFKAPFIDGVRKIEIRERKTVEDLAAATKNQLPVTATVSVNWTASADAVMDIYKKYGSLGQFQERILDPKLREAAKAAIGKFNADELIRDRQAATAEVLAILTDLMAGYPVSVNSPQIENVALPEVYMKSVLEKEQARENAAREQYNLERQRLESLQTVQTAEAQRDALKAQADGNAYKVRTEAEAEADATRLRKAAEAQGIRDVEKALAANPLFIEYTRAQRWNGQLPQTMMGQDTDVLMSVK